MINLPSKFKYFALTIFADSLFINSTILLYLGWGSYSFFLGLFVALLWFVSNVIFYPNSNRRYTNFIHSFYNVVLPFGIFLILYLLLIKIYYGDIENSPAILLFFITLGIGILFSKAIFVFSLRFYRRNGYGYSNYLVIGSKPVRNYIRKVFRKRKDGGYKFQGGYEWSSSIFDESKNQFDFIVEQEIDEVYLHVSEENEYQCNQLVQFLTAQNISCFLIPFDANKHVNFYNFRRINGNSFAAIMYGPLLKKRYRLIKRAFDIFFSSLVIIFLLSWLIPILALLIKLDSSGPVFFVQSRAGRNDSFFPCFKLRSMTVNDESDNLQANKSDARITKIGAKLRATNLDEIPQFFNVLLGHMSIVGPRPHIEYLNKKFIHVEGYSIRFRVKPGITGLSQIYGYRGETPTAEIMKERTDTDKIYIQNWSFLLDLRIVYNTTRSTLSRSNQNAY